ncbi:type II toxin-antitoxin system HicA family toxin [Halomonas daqiaonensis]|uniref:Predicted RNA binding protein YcfA, dsRBD-like fold, HicA-like mRNA interferase family n=1 Tax=Halomonas daqiaonensis TaxID=650850 RepID=A0A1H7VM18_9GAMM|nr:type II toxin-antitoxin system HicA family toxin [Halomonas daqiaonensis]SEM10286.1 Predicted RNA binding protein YcfA, dsRBD-like fold, HicA-like mRNA interferase family [Halomonas daqiaonensis]
MKSCELIKELEADGWTLDRIKGSHHHFRHPTKPGTITVPHPKKDLKKGLIQGAESKPASSEAGHHRRATGDTHALSHRH